MQGHTARRPPVVKFAAYRQYLDQVQQANSAVMALLGGSQLAIHTLQLTEGSDRTMGEIFPSVPHIERFNLKTAAASAYLKDAEPHLSAMAIPYILSIHESLFGVFERMLKKSGTKVPRKNPMRSPVWVIRDFWKADGESLEDESWLVFELLAELRHDIIHRAGVVGSKLVSTAKTLTPEATSVWQRMAHKPLPTFVKGEKHLFDHAEMVACLAVIKFLAAESNLIMQRRYPRSMWLTDFVEDVTTTQGRLTGNPSQKARRTRTFARLNYGPLNFTVPEIEQEIVTQGK